MSTRADNGRMTLEVLKEHFNYDPETGFFVRIKSPNGSKKHVGKILCRKNNFGYVIVSFKHVPYHAHRLAWLYMTGSWPTQVIDHIDGNRSNNKIINLRDVSHTWNMQNHANRPRKHSNSGFLGVTKSKCGNKFVSNICIGTFNTAEEAHQRYLEVKRFLHAGCTI